MLYNIKKNIKKIFKFFNIRLSNFENTKKKYLKILESQKINFIFDIGANEGQFAMEVLENGFKGQIISFEPTTEAYKKLQINSSKFQNWYVYKKVAIGNKNQKIKINVAGNSAQSSSILNMRESHKKSAPDSVYIKHENVELITLDSIFNNYFKKKINYLLKIDVQGFEYNVLLGAIKSIKKIKAVKLECSLISLYEKDKNFEYYFNFFKKNGFKLFDIDPGFSNPKTGQLLQFDALFIRD